MPHYIGILQERSHHLRSAVETDTGKGKRCRESRCQILELRSILVFRLVNLVADILPQWWHGVDHSSLVTERNRETRTEEGVRSDMQSNGKLAKRYAKA